VLWDLVQSEETAVDKKATLLFFDQALGLALDRPLLSKQIPPAVINLADQREQSRLTKDWVAADRFRVQIEQMGFHIEDTSTGYRLVEK